MDKNLIGSMLLVFLAAAIPYVLSEAEEELIQVSGANDWYNLMKKSYNKKNIIFTYTESTGTPLHDYMMKAAISYKDQLQFAYTSDREVIEVIFPDVEPDERAVVWLSTCVHVVPMEICNTVKFPYKLSESELTTALNSLLIPHTVVVENKKDAENLEASINAATNVGADIIMLIACPTKMSKAVNLAIGACSNTPAKAKCIVIKGDVAIEGVSNYVVEDRIHMSVLSIDGPQHDIQVGYLLSETSQEILHQWERLVSSRTFNKRLSKQENPPDLLVEGSDSGDDDYDVKSANDMQDDPVAFSVHSNKALHDLYLYDYKTIPRLTDVTYDELIASDKYAVILFTLEFNAKSLAVLSNFVNIHKELIANDGTSPMHRVECFDWPDVCDKAGFYTYPRMVFYRANEKRTPYEYEGIWSENDMKKAVLLYSLPWPVVVETKSSLQKVLEISVGSSVLGVIATEGAESAFYDAALMMAKQHMFVMVKGEAANFLASLQPRRVLKGKDVLLARINHKFLEKSLQFSTLKDAASFTEAAFDDEFMKELTVLNFEKILGQSVSLFIQYKDLSLEENPSEAHLTEILSNISRVYNGRARFVWMDKAPGTVGEYVSRLHSKGEMIGAAVAFIRQGSVSIESFSEKTGTSVVQAWVDRCLSGTADVSFKMINHDWKPRLPGHDFLQYMLEEGSLPVDSKSVSEEEDMEAIPNKHPVRELTRIIKNRVEMKEDVAAAAMPETVSVHTEL